MWGWIFETAGNSTACPCINEEILRFRISRKYGRNVPSLFIVLSVVGIHDYMEFIT